LFVMVSLDRLRDGFARAGHSIAPPGFVHTLPTSLRPLPGQPAFSGCGNYPVADPRSRFSRVEFLCVRGVFDSAGPRCTRATAHRVIAFRLTRHRPLPDSQISELNIPPAYTPVQRFECNLTAALAWLGARLVRYSFSCMDFS